MKIIYPVQISPTKGIILDSGGIKKLYQTGRGTIYLRGKAEIKTNEEKEEIIITEIPYAVKKEDLVKKIAEFSQWKSH